MIKYNNNPMNNNFWYLFTQLISQLSQMHKKSDIAMTKWEQHFQKLQHGLIFDENNPDVIESSEDENCNKNLIQNDTGSSQNKSYDKHKIYSLDECVGNKIKKLLVIQRHLNIKKKRWTFNLIYKNLPTKQIIQKTKQHKKTNTKIYVYATKKIFKIQMKKTSLI